jgi:hypothetical protein
MSIDGDGPTGAGDSELLLNGVGRFEGLIDSMDTSMDKESVPTIAHARPGSSRAAWRRVDDCRESQWLKQQLSDWDD